MGSLWEHINTPWAKEVVAALVLASNLTTTLNLVKQATKIVEIGEWVVE
jgi:hypothetical protein